MTGWFVAAVLGAGLALSLGLAWWVIAIVAFALLMVALVVLLVLMLESSNEWPGL